MTHALPIPDSGPVTEYNTAQPWQRQPCDDDPQWAAFRLWLTAPLPRNVLWLAQHCPGIAPYQLQRWRERLGWDLRADAFDNYTHQYFQQRVLAYVDEHARDYIQHHIDLLVKARKLATNELDKFLRASVESPGLGLLTAREVTTLLEAAIKLERLVRGDATENVHKTIDLSALSPEDLIAIRSIQRRAGIE